MDVVYILGKGSKWSNNELRYSLRSVEKYVTDLGNVFIVGECPGWLQNVIHLPCLPDGPVKERNIMEKIMVACECPLIRDAGEFYLFNDDHFLLESIDADLPHYYQGTLAEFLLTRENIKNEYTRAVENTVDVCRVLDQSLYYDIHCPMIINPFCFMDAMASFNWGVEPGYLVKSLYANVYEQNLKPQSKKQQPLLDCQISVPQTVAQIDEILRDKPFFSIHDSALRGGGLRLWFETRYPDKSRFEQDLPMDVVFSQDQFDHWRYEISNAGMEAIGVIAKDMKGQLSLLPSDESGFLELKRAMKYLIAALPVG